MSAIIWTVSSVGADGWVNYFNSISANPSRTTPGMYWRTVKKEGPIRHFNKAGEICGHLNAAVPTIFAGVSGFSIG